MLFPHPEARVSWSQCTRNSGPGDGYDKYMTQVPEEIEDRVKKTCPRISFSVVGSFSSRMISQEIPYQFFGYFGASDGNPEIVFF